MKKVLKKIGKILGIILLFIFDGVAWYDDPRNLNAHTIISTPVVWLPFEEQGQSVAGWLNKVCGQLRFRLNMRFFSDTISILNHKNSGLQEV